MNAKYPFQITTVQISPLAKAKQKFNLSIPPKYSIHVDNKLFMKITKMECDKTEISSFWKYILSCF